MSGEIWLWVQWLGQQTTSQQDSVCVQSSSCKLAPDRDASAVTLVGSSLRGPGDMENAPGLEVRTLYLFT